MVNCVSTALVLLGAVCLSARAHAHDEKRKSPYSASVQRGLLDSINPSKYMNSDSSKDDVVYATDDYHTLQCEEFCHNYIAVCVNTNYFTGGYEGCLDSCAGFARIPWEPVYDLSFDPINLGSDTLACRATHLSFAMQFGGEGDVNRARQSPDAFFHCGHASPDGEFICVDYAPPGGMNPFQIMTNGLDTWRKFGHCYLAANDRVANCMRLGLGDEGMAGALELLPKDRVEHLFLHANDLTSIPSQVTEFTNLKSLYVDGNDVTTVSQSDFAGLSRLETISMNLNPIQTLPADLLQDQPELKTFSYFNGDLQGDLPRGLFQNTPKLVNMVMYGHQGVTAFEDGALDGLRDLKILSFVDCGFNWDGFPDGIFDDLVSLEAWDFFGNQLTGSIPAGLFGAWSANLFRIVLWNNPDLVGIEEDALVNLENLQKIFLHLTGISADDIAEEIPKITSDKFTVLTSP